MQEFKNNDNSLNSSELDSKLKNEIRLSYESKKKISIEDNELLQDTELNIELNTELDTKLIEEELAEEDSISGLMKEYKLNRNYFCLLEKELDEIIKKTNGEMTMTRMRFECAMLKVDNFMKNAIISFDGHDAYLCLELGEILDELIKNIKEAYKFEAKIYNEDMTAHLTKMFMVDIRATIILRKYRRLEDLEYKKDLSQKNVHT